ncbi:Rhodanese-related sulfurtransferase [Methanophagales archaeon]|nr:Rhodanese-related sulfurtransferase [Methanophagales archaeon]
MQRKVNIKLGMAVVAVIVLLFSFACLQVAFATQPAAEDEIKIVALSTDKDVYQEKEEMDIFLSVYAPEEISDVVIGISGVKSKKGVYFVSLSNKTDLKAGDNEMTFTKKLPSCSRCAGIDLGTYTLNASIVHDDVVVNAIHSIVLTSPGKKAYVNVTIDEVKRRIETDELMLLDLRTKEEYDSAHIAGALIIPFPELRNASEELNKNKKIMLYCENGSNSTIASKILIENGFDKVYNVLDGISAWNESGYALVSGTTTDQPGFEVALALASLLAVAFWIRRRRV